MARVWDFSTFRGCDVSFLAYLVNGQGTALLLGDVESVTLHVRRQNDPEPVVDAEAIDPSDVVLELSSDPRWNSEILTASPGRNFVHDMPGTVFAIQDFYRVEYTFALTGGGKSKLIFEGPARSSEG